MISIEISNVAKIKKANIELAGVTVVAGFNGTGKSTIAKSVFCALNSKKDILQKIHNDQSQELQKLLAKWFQSMDVNLSKSEIWFFDTEQISELILRYYNENRSKNSEELYLGIIRTLEEYCRINGIEIGARENIANKILTVLNRDMFEYILFFIEQYYKAVFQMQINNFTDSKKASIKYEKVDGNNLFDSEIIIRNNEVSSISGSTITQFENAIYIETCSALDFCNDISRGRFGRSEPVMNISTQELIDYIQLDNELSFSESKELDDNKKIVSQIMEQVTHGQLRQAKNGKIEFFDNDSKMKIEFSNMSAGLKIFALIQRLLENYSLKKSDVLIVDEPEVNLHPKWQVILAEVMVRISKELGIYILINSHSPYFIRAIEVKMAEYECADKANFYYMKESGDKFIAENVNGNLEVIYKALYEPLEDL